MTIMKNLKIKLSWPHWYHGIDNGQNRCYRVEQVVDSILYNPGQYLSASEVGDMCESDVWSVLIVPNKKEK